MANITAVIKARNEEANIHECIESARLLADEIIVVDDSSTDSTASLAKEAGARVVQGDAHNGCIDHLDYQGFCEASGNWILRMDADERMTETLAIRLGDIAAQNAAIDGVEYARIQYFCGGWLRHGGWFKNDQLRFFRSDRWNREWNCAPHSQVRVDGPILRLPLDPSMATMHYDYTSVRQFLERSLVGYSHAEAHERYERGERFMLARLLLKPAKRFFGRLIIRRGFLDGVRGVVIAVLLAAYDVSVELQMWDLAREDDGK